MTREQELKELGYTEPEAGRCYRVDKINRQGSREMMSIWVKRKLGSFVFRVQVAPSAEFGDLIVLPPSAQCGWQWVFVRDNPARREKDIRLTWVQWDPEYERRKRKFGQIPLRLPPAP